MVTSNRLNVDGSNPAYGFGPGRRNFGVDEGHSLVAGLPCTGIAVQLQLAYTLDENIPLPHWMSRSRLTPTTHVARVLLSLQVFPGSLEPIPTNLFPQV